MKTAQDVRQSMVVRSNSILQRDEIKKIEQMAQTEADKDGFYILVERDSLNVVTQLYLQDNGYSVLNVRNGEVKQTRISWL